MDFFFCIYCNDEFCIKENLKNVDTKFAGTASLVLMAFKKNIGTLVFAYY